MNTPDKIVTRFAPSPTGFMHIGSARTALFAYLYAKKNNGTFILRIEDTDKAREVGGSIAHIQESLNWLGINWDYGPDKPGPFGSCIQSERLDIYRKYAQKLYEKGLAYPDPYTEDELETFRAEAKAQKQPYLYRNHRPEKIDSWDGNKPLRLKVPEIKRYTWTDEVRGELSGGEEMLDDFILMKADGYPTYNFAHIIDDYEMGVTHIMRGDEFIASTPKFLSLYDALEIPWPKFVTLPPIMGPDGKKKLSKRDQAKDLLEYRTEGYLPEAMCNFLALIGWNPGGNVEIFPSEKLIAAFDIGKIQRSGGAFNEDKLKWMNKEYLDLMDEQSLADYIAKGIPDGIKVLPQYSDERLQKLSPSIGERIHTHNEVRQRALEGEFNWAFSEPNYEATLLQWKHDRSYKDALPRIQQVLKLLEDTDFNTPETIKNTLWGYAEEVGKGEVLWPTRVALTGQERSPDPFTCAFVLGKEESLKRLESAVLKLSNEYA